MVTRRTPQKTLDLQETYQIFFLTFANPIVQFRCADAIQCTNLK
jgi:hypothetical protein